MKQKIMVTGILLLLLCAVASPLFSESNFRPAIQVSVQPWANWSLSSGGFFRFELEPSVYTSVELGLKYKDWLNFLFGVDYNVNDNYIGQLMDSRAFARIMGQLGIKDFSVRAGFGQVQGTAEWKGQFLEGTPQTKAGVNTQYTELVLFWAPELGGAKALNFGLIYTNFQTPLSWMGGGGQNDGAYDTTWLEAVNLDYYGIHLQLSSFQALVHGDKPAVSLLLEMSLSGGVTVMREFSEENKRRIVVHTQKDPGEFERTGGGLTWQGIFGLCGLFKIKSLRVGLGAGYDLFTQYSSTGGLWSSLFRHGFAARVYLSL